MMDAQMMDAQMTLQRRLSAAGAFSLIEGDAPR